jgi:general secretion pathway protein I
MKSRRGPSLPRRRSAFALPATRGGLTLLEVILSVAIFLGSLTAIMKILDNGRESELMTRMQTEAVMRCEAKMAEVVAGIEEAVTSGDQPFSDSEDGSWTWRMDVVDSGIPGLLQVNVTVERKIGSTPLASFTLLRYMRDPQLFIDAALASSGEES